MKIVTDTSTLFSPAEGEELGLKVLPLSVTINKETWKEYVDIYPNEFLEKVKAGGIPTSSQPSVGETLEVFETVKDDILVISMCDGLSGTYRSAVGAKNSIENNENITVINTKTLCGPHRYMVKKALEMKDNGSTYQEIIDKMNHYTNNHISFLIPYDFGFLKRGGRLTPAAATILGMLKVVPLMTQTKDFLKLESCGIKRTFKAAILEICKTLKEFGANEKYLISISHAGFIERVNEAKAIIQKHFPDTENEVLELSPAFITQGGPGCVAIQAIIK